jgi:hypothetical protein
MIRYVVLVLTRRQIELILSVSMLWISITTDIWTDPDLHSFLGFTAHFCIRDENRHLLIANRLLAFLIVEGKPDGENTCENHVLCRQGCRCFTRGITRILSIITGILSIITHILITGISSITGILSIARILSRSLNQSVNIWPSEATPFVQLISPKTFPIACFISRVYPASKSSSHQISGS